jgi:hypothetical protein
MVTRRSNACAGRTNCWSNFSHGGYNPGPMNRDPFDDLFSKYFGHDGDLRAVLWNPLHPQALLFVLLALIAVLATSLLTRGGG